MKITACVIVKNEEKNLVKWIAAMQKIAHEMIVVDTGSTDNTVELAKKSGAKVFNYEWKNDFASAKNFAIDQASGEWILFLDADEYFSPNCIKKVPLEIARLDKSKNIDAIVCRIVNIDEDVKGRIINTFCNIRIFRNKPYLRYTAKIHEFLVSSQGAIRLFSLDKVLDVYHTGYSSSIIQSKLNRNLAILQAETRAHGEREDQYRYFCDCYHGLGDFEKTIEYAQKHIKSNFFTVGGDHEIYKNLLNAMFALKKPETDILQVLTEAKNEYPNEPTFCLYEGVYYINNNKYEQAKSALKKALELSENRELQGYEADMFILNRADLYYFLAKVALHDKDETTAISYLWTGLSINKYEKSLIKLFYSLIQNGDIIDAISLLNQLYQIEKNDDLLFLLNICKEFSPSKIEAYYMNLAIKRKIVEPNPYRQLVALDKRAEATAVLAKEIKLQYFKLLIATYKLKDEKKFVELKVLLPKSYIFIGKYLLTGICEFSEIDKGLYKELVELAKSENIELPLLPEENLNYKVQNTSNMPKISVLIPTYNRPDYLKIAVESVLAQTYKNFELIISDNSTNDLTKQMLLPYLQADKRIKYFWHANKGYGFTENWNWLMNYPTQEYINWLMDDDFFYPTKLEKMMRIYQENDNIALVTSARNIIDGSGKLIDTIQKTPRDAIIRGSDIGGWLLQKQDNCIGEPTTVLMRKSLLKNGKFGWRKWVNDAYQYSAIIDIETWLHLSTQGDIAFIAEPLSAFRKHDGQDQKKNEVISNSWINWYELIKYAYEQKIFLTNSQELLIALKNYNDNMKRISEELERLGLKGEAADMLHSYRKLAINDVAHYSSK